MIDRNHIMGLLSGLAGLAVLAVAAPLPAQQSGAEIWGRECGRCHRAQPPNKFDADFWHAIVAHMALQAHLTSAQEKAVQEFLMGAARPLTMAEPTSPLPQLASADPSFIVSGAPTGEEIYKKQCVACHGKTGKGDGPAAVAFNPRPANLTDGKLLGQLNDEQLAEIIAHGKGAMPAFARLLSPEELEQVEAYVRSLSSGAGGEK